ncbi:hypothetical protein Sjap_009962 [Stephania japonica]|uniref:Rhodanese domain-containing protein n=1 Tax=Stephania japonica TaxID=461633 RepID=A0AAP0P5Y5_9MAGN
MGVSNFSLTSFSGFLCLLFFSSAAASVVTIDIHQAKHHILSNRHRYLDVRTTEEFNAGHVNVDNPLNIPYMFQTPQGRVKNHEFLERVSSACNKDDHLVVGCQTGVRSLHASADLLKAGFKHVTNMGGGYVAWKENGLGVKIVGDQNISPQSVCCEANAVTPSEACMRSLQAGLGHMAAACAGGAAEAAKHTTKMGIES